MTKDFSAVFNAHPQYIDTMYQSWLAEPTSVEADWQAFFKGFDFALNPSPDPSPNGRGDTTNVTLSAGASGISSPLPLGAGAGEGLTKEFAVIGLIHGYRDRGHTLSTTNPIKPRKNRKPRLELRDYGLSDADLDKKFAAGYEIGLPNATLREIIERLQQLYTGNIALRALIF
jgi:2-oxoglutarate dehydrogenase E1 component